MIPTQEQIEQLVADLNASTQREMIRIKLSLSDSLALTDSKFGGMPYIPKGGSLPTSAEGKPLFMLAQINCEQLPENNIYPKKGLLQFWIAKDDYFGADFKNLCQNNTKKVLYFPEFSDNLPVEQIKKLYEKAILSKEIGKNFIGQEYEIELPFDPNKSLALNFESTHESISLQDINFNKLIVEKWNETFPNKISGFWGLSKEILSIFYKSISTGFGHKIGGYPDFAQEDPREVDDPHKILLLQINSEYNDDFSISWADGVANFFISPEDLAKCQFDDVMYYWGCT